MPGQRGNLLSGRPDAHRPHVAVGILDHHLAPAVAVRGRGLDDRGADPPGGALDDVWIDPEQPELGAEAPALAARQRRVPGMLVVGVVGVEHELDAVHREGREIRVRIVNPRREHLPVKLDGPRDLAHEQVHRQHGEPAPKTVGGHPRIARALLHRRTTRRAFSSWRGRLRGGTARTSSRMPSPTRSASCTERTVASSPTSSSTRTSSSSPARKTSSWNSSTAVNRRTIPSTAEGKTLTPRTISMSSRRPRIPPPGWRACTGTRTAPRQRSIPRSWAPSTRWSA